MRTSIFISFLCLTLILGSCGSDDWITIFNGETLDGWTASENTDSWIIKDGTIITNGPRSHLFYSGEVMDHRFLNFELMADVKTESHANSGIYIHTAFQEEGWPAKGYECQVFCSKQDADSGEYVENKMTGSLYAVRNTWKSPVPDGEWFNYHIVVRGKTIQTYINNRLICEYTEPATIYRSEDWLGRKLSSGTVALQCHDPDSRVYFKNIKVKPLPDDLPTQGIPQDDEKFEELLIDLAESNIPMVDLHVHLKGGLSIETAQANARKYGFTYGYAINCGLQMGFESDAEVAEYLAGYEPLPQTWHAMQAEGREWLDMFSPETREKFDYVFTDAMTWTNDNGKRMRLWIEEETEVGDPQDFMEQLVTRIETIFSNEPVAIYVNPTYLPDEIMDKYDELWTTERMDRVIKVLKDNKVALEINCRRMIPSPTFIKRAKNAGVKFTFGTNNGGANDLGRMEYALRMVDECGLSSGDIWLPE
ncbi:family 16 glycoside hydrolase [Bacteroidota bacterium]